jgi:hypothetical protein
MEDCEGGVEPTHVHSGRGVGDVTMHCHGVSSCRQVGTTAIDSGHDALLAVVSAVSRQRGGRRPGPQQLDSGVSTGTYLVAAARADSLKELSARGARALGNFQMRGPC